MDSDTKWLAILVLGIVALCVAGLLAGLAIDNYNDRRMAELGYQQEMAPGRQSPIWRKADAE